MESSISQHTRHPVIVVMLRQPRHNANEKRDDPFYEFGSFGCTGCHDKNVMNPARINEVKGARIAFAQGGLKSIKLVYLTSPVSVVKHKDRCELTWKESMPFRYEAAPILADDTGHSDFSLLHDFLSGTNRTTLMGKFASRFRTRRTPLCEDIGEQIVAVYEQMRQRAEASQIATSYEQSMPYPPPLIDRNRAATYATIQRELKLDNPSCGSSSKGSDRPKRC